MFLSFEASCVRPPPLIPDICCTRVYHVRPRVHLLAYIITTRHNFTIRADYFLEIASLAEERDNWRWGISWIGQCRPFMPRTRRRRGREGTQWSFSHRESASLPGYNCESLHSAFTRVHAPTRTVFQSFLSAKSASRSRSCSSWQKWT